jgi:PPOX class probable FMN-dependent enzyme
MRETGMDTAGLVRITSEADLRELVGEPSPRVANKARSVLQEEHRQWLAHSPFCLLATAGADGTCDVSPKGDPPGFALVLDDRTIAIPDRPGNKRVDGFRNVLANPHAGLIFLIPGRSDTLRINGRASLLRDAPFFDRLIVQGHRPRLALLVEVEQVFFHCAKAFLRSSLWDAQSWLPADELPSRARLVHALERPEDSLDEVERHYGPEYAKTLY